MVNKFALKSAQLLGTVQTLTAAGGRRSGGLASHVGSGCHCLSSSLSHTAFRKRPWLQWRGRVPWSAASPACPVLSPGVPSSVTRQGSSAPGTAQWDHAPHVSLSRHEVRGTVVEAGSSKGFLGAGRQGEDDPVQTGADPRPPAPPALPRPRLPADGGGGGTCRFQLRFPHLGAAGV